jgi:acyl-homoserine lactone acylase PvdQ
MSLKRSLCVAGKVLLIGIPSLILILVTRGEIVRKSFAKAVSKLSGAFGEDSGTWTWGRLWSSGRYRPVLASREAVDREAEGRLVLSPEGAVK